ncbi:MAG: hypothetical protein LC130_03790, partial [Bryobacterales bacterium]|nr:hypothetical protein [Bryobacterales bacterium]
LLLGIVFAFSNRNTGKLKYVTAYIAGSEVLWRMTNAQMFWEAGKYFIIFILGIALLRTKHWQRAGWPVFYFLFLAFSIPLTILAVGASSAARDAVSFNLSGPLALTVCALYFSQITIDEDEMRQVIWWLAIPIVSVAALALFGTLSAETITFTDESNFATSGGFGPNQVSAILGLGGALAFLLFLTGKGAMLRGLAVGISLGLLSLSALTFSRGGIYNAAVVVFLALAHSLRDKRWRLFAVLGLAMIGLAGGYLIYPRLNTFTGGMLQQRFLDTDPTLRGPIARADLELWYANPILGVGPGMSIRMRNMFAGVAAHTEYTRILAEHGSAGLLALLILLGLAARAYFKAPDAQAQLWVAALVAWPLAEMAHAAMRIVVISFLFGLALVNWRTDTPEKQPIPERPKWR